MSLCFALIVFAVKKACKKDIVYFTERRYGRME